MSTLARFMVKVAGATTEGATINRHRGKVDPEQFFNGWYSAWLHLIEPILKIRKGVDVALWQPFGRFDGRGVHAGSSFALDGWLLADERNLGFLKHGFLETFRPALRSGEIRTLVIYQGSAREDLHDMPRIMAALEPVFTLAAEFPGRVASMHDGASGCEKGSLTHRMLMTLADHDIEAITEAIPRRTQEHLLEFSSGAIERFFLGNLDGSTITRWADGHGWLGGESKRRFTPADHARAGSNQHWFAGLNNERQFDDADGYFEHLSRRIAQGFITWMPLNNVKKHGGAELLDRLEAAHPIADRQAFNRVLGNLWQTGEPGIPGDVTGDGRVDMADVNWLLGNWGHRIGVAPLEQAAQYTPARVVSGADHDAG